MGAGRSIRLVVGLAVLSVVLAGGPALASVVPGGPGWAATATGATHLRHATPLGAAPASARVPVSISLVPRDQATLGALIADQANPASSSYHRYLTPAEFSSRFGATAAQLDAVRSYLRSVGLSAVTVNPNHLAVTAQATVKTATKAFHTRLGLFRQGGRMVVANTAPALVPRSLSGVISGVVGLNQAQSAHGFTRATTAFVSPSGFNLPALAAAYDATSLPAASSSSMAVLAEGNLTPVVADLRRAEAANGLPQVPVTIVPTGPASPDTSGIDEWDLDTQSSTAMVGNLKMLYLYAAPDLADTSIVTEIMAFVSQDRAPAGSVSFGECDSQAIGDGTEAAIHTALQEALAQGQTLFASSGDGGSTCAVDNSGGPALEEPSYPASDTNAAGVGGTSLTASGGRYSAETAWNGSGGGVSTLPPGPWAVNADRTVTPSGRGVPDVAMDGDPNTGANIVVSGQVGTIGGTSLASPLALGAWTRIDAAEGGRLGPATPAIYGLYNTAHPAGSGGGATPGLHDVTTGSNGAFFAQPGYDLVTGLGTIDAAALARALTPPPVAPPGESYTAISPTRITDTRAGSGQANAGHTLGPQGTVTVGVPAAVPAGSGAVALSVTAVDPTRAGYLSVYPAGATANSTSALNFVAGGPNCSTVDCVVPNLVITPVSAAGQLVVFNGAAGSVDVVVDIEGYFNTAGATTTGVGHYDAVAPARLVDTRCAAASPNRAATCAAEQLPAPNRALGTVAGGATLDVAVGGQSGVPADAEAAVVQLTATDTTSGGFLTAYPTQTTAAPTSSNVNFVAGQTTSNRAIVRLGANGQITVFNNTGATDVVIDVVGYFSGTSGGATSGSLYTPINPSRLVDTRTFSATGLPPSTSGPLAVAGAPGIPANATAAALNVTEASATAGGFVTVTPTAITPPASTSDVNFTAREIRANADLAGLSSTGAISLYNNAGNTQVVVDAFGFFVPA